ncbi:hypothetical protein OIU85_027187 [Salix viminalis]|uniref:Uncharacterized protein n=1 Tax=Salix viminalis TaxID=40686 RepID=A0A9Q0QI84_SALVM|nr:hypothetical protein OIU85_027187 [Salix viminalis]
MLDDIYAPDLEVNEEKDRPNDDWFPPSYSPVPSLLCSAPLLLGLKELLQWNGRWHFIHYDDDDDDDFLTSQFPMLRLLCKSIVIGSSVRASPAHYFLENPSILSCLRNISSVNTDDNIKEHSFTVSYLPNKMWVLSENLLYKLLNRSILKPQMSLILLLPFSRTMASKQVQRLENQLVPAFDFLETSLQSDAVAIKAIKRFPRVLNVTVETIARVVDVLRDNGVPGKEHCSANLFPAFRYGFKSGEFKKAYRGSDSNGISSFQDSVS